MVVRWWGGGADGPAAAVQPRTVTSLHGPGGPGQGGCGGGGDRGGGDVVVVVVAGKGEPGGGLVSQLFATRVGRCLARLVAPGSEIGAGPDVLAGDGGRIPDE